MNELQLAQHEEDMESLRRAIPSWQNTKVEPFIHDTPVIPPIWNKAKLDQNFFTDSDGSGGSDATVNFIAGEEQGSAFVPMLITASGSAAEIP